MSTWHRTYWSVFVANLVTAVGMMSFLPFFPSLLEEMGLEDQKAISRWAGVVFGAAPLAAALMGPVWGSIGDRIGRKVMVLRAMLAITLFVGCMGFVRTPWELLVLRFCQGMFSGFVPPSITLVSISAPKERQGRVAGSLQAAVAAGAIVGPLMGAWVQSVWGMRSIFTVVSVLSGLGALCVLLFAEEDRELRTAFEGFAPKRLLGAVWQDLKLLFRKPRLRATLVVLFVVQFGLGATNPQLELFVETLGLEEAGVTLSGEERRSLTAWLFTAFAAAGVVSTSVWGSLGDRIGHARVMVTASLAAAVVLGLHAFVTAYALVLGVRILLGLASTGPNASAWGLAAEETTPETRGGAFGTIFSARSLAVSIGSMTGGFLASLVGIRMLFALAAVAVCCALVAARGAWGTAEQPERGHGVV